MPDTALRLRFDELLSRLIDDLPQPLRERLEEVPVIVEDEPPAELMRHLGLDRRRVELCGLHSGIPLTRRSVEHSGQLPDRINLFRGPIMRMVHRRAGGRATIDDLEQQIRITLLHEIGHHFGLDEDDLRRLGYG